MQYTRLALLALLAATTAFALPRPQEGEPEDTDNPTDIGNPTEAGIEAGDGSSTTTESPDGLPATAVDCTLNGVGNHTGADIQTLLAGWAAYSSLADHSGGPYLSGAMSTVFHTNEYDWSEYGVGSGDKSGHEYCGDCMTKGINAGASDITCLIQPGGFIVASFTDKMMLGKKP